jgi:hypothetical protein
MSEPKTLHVSAGAIKALRMGAGVFLVCPWPVEAGELVRLQAGELTGLFTVHSATNTNGYWAVRIGGEE